MLEIQKNNPLHGLKLEVLLTELVDHYGWEILASELNLNCFKSNPSIKSSLKFLRKTLWAREKVEGFYLYKFKRLPKPDDIEYELPPRDRTIPLDQKPREPAVITPRETSTEAKTSKTQKDSPWPSRNQRDSRPSSKDKEPRREKKSTSGDVWSHWRKDSE